MLNSSLNWPAVITALIVLNTANAATTCDLIPGQWQPTLDQVKAKLVESLSISNGQQALNEVSQNTADLSDAQLFIVYVRLLQSLDQKKRSILYTEQQRWLEQRELKAKAATTSTGGSLGNLEFTGAYKKITESRLKELQKRLQQSVNHCH